MRNLTRLVPAALLFIAACASTTTTPQAAAPVPRPSQVEDPASERPRSSGAIPIPSRGLTCRSAIAIDATTDSDGAVKEDAWIQDNYPGATKTSTTVTACEGKPAHQIDLQTANGRKVTLFFDITGWTAKVK